MGLVKGLKGINAHREAEEAKFAGKGDSDSPKNRWFKIEDKQTVKVLFLQELDEDAPNFSPKNGLGFLAVEHSNPKDFRKKALCTIDDEGACWACEQHQKDYKAGWKQKNKLYINVLVDDGKNEPYVAILSQGFSGRSITPTLLEFAQGDEDVPDSNTITDKWYKIKRTGSKLDDTSYVILPSAASKEDVESYELSDLNRAVYSVPYAQQEAHYLDGQSLEEEVKEPVLVGASGSDDNEW